VQIGIFLTVLHFSYDMLTMIIRYDIDTDNWNAPYVLPRSSSLKTSLFLLRDVVAKPSLA